MAAPLHTDEKHICAKGDAICIPSNYSKFDLPDESLTTVNVGIDIKDIPKIDDKEFSITLNAFFVVRWTDTRMIIDLVSCLLLHNYLGIMNFETLFSTKPWIGSKNFLKSTFLAIFFYEISFFESQNSIIY